jgi:regulator of replication initiation timing
MKVLQVLEEKITVLVEMVRELKRENAKLVEENAQLLAKVDSLKGSVLEDSKRKEETVLAVDDLIKSIDCLVKENQQ